MSLFSSKAAKSVPAPSAASATPKTGGVQLRSWAATISKIPKDKARELVIGTLAVNVATFEENYAKLRNKSADRREANLVFVLLSNLVGGNYLGFLAAHALTYVNRVRGLDWAPSSEQEIMHIAETGGVLLLHPHYQMTADQSAKEQAILAHEPTQNGAGAVAAIIKSAQWNVARMVLCAGMDTLARNLMEVWSSPEAHERLLYQTFMLCLRTDNTMGALLLHQLAMAHHQRGWDWRPSPDEFHAVAETAARALVDRRYNAIKLVS